VVEGRLQRLVLDLHQVDQTRNVFWSPENLPNFVGKPEKKYNFQNKTISNLNLKQKQFNRVLVSLPVKNILGKLLKIDEHEQT
jgi:hypothetical protein